MRIKLELPKALKKKNIHAEEGRQKRKAAT